jgi:hypothetical protein
MKIRLNLSILTKMTTVFESVDIEERDGGGQKTKAMLLFGILNELLTKS